MWPVQNYQVVTVLDNQFSVHPWLSAQQVPALVYLSLLISSFKIEQLVKLIIFRKI